MTGSPDSSSDSSTGGSPQHASNAYQASSRSQQPQQPLTTASAEGILPGVLMSRDKRINPFLCQLADLGSQLQNAQLRDAARNLLRLLPADPLSVERIFSTCIVHQDETIAQSTQNTGSDASTLQSPKLEDVFMSTSPSTLLYHLEVVNLHLLFIYIHVYIYYFYLKKKNKVLTLKFFSGGIQFTDAGQSFICR